MPDLYYVEFMINVTPNKIHIDMFENIIVHLHQFIGVLDRKTPWSDFFKFHFMTCTLIFVQKELEI